MSNPLVISPKECQGFYWTPPKDLAFAADKALLPLHAGELGRAASSMPLALVKENREWQLRAVCGLKPRENLFIRDGRWLGNYQPQRLSTWPFEVVNLGEKSLITIDRDCGLVGQDGTASGAEPFFDEQQQPGPALARVLEVLKHSNVRQLVTDRAVKALAAAGVLAPWPETLVSQLGMEIEGLHMVDEKAMAELDDAAFLALRKAQALPIAYAVNFSIPQGHLLARLAKLQPGKTSLPENLDDLFSDDDYLKFDFDD